MKHVLAFTCLLYLLLPAWAEEIRVHLIGCETSSDAPVRTRTL
jgi:hypothetical protein